MLPGGETFTILFLSPAQQDLPSGVHLISRNTCFGWLWKYKVNVKGPFLATIHLSLKLLMGLFACGGMHQVENSSCIVEVSSGGASSSIPGFSRVLLSPNISNTGKLHSTD